VAGTTKSDPVIILKEANTKKLILKDCLILQKSNSYGVVYMDPSVDDYYLSSYNSLLGTQNTNSSVILSDGDNGTVLLINTYLETGATYSVDIPGSLEDLYVFSSLSNKTSNVGGTTTNSITVDASFILI